MRTLSSLLLTLVIAGTPTAGHAQFGRLKAAAQRVSGNQNQPAQPVNVKLTADVVTRYLEALKARHTELERRSHRNSDEGRYFAALLRQEAQTRRQHDYRQHRGADWAERQRLAALYTATSDTGATMGLVRLEADVNASVPLPESSWEDQRKANASLDTVAMNGGGFSAGEWMDLGEKMTRIVSAMSWDAADADSTVKQIAQMSNVTPDEVRIVRARRIDLAIAMGYAYRTDEEIVEANKPPPTPEESTDPQVRYSACLQHELLPFIDEAKRRENEFNAARARNDLSPMMEYGTRLAQAQMAAQEKCGPILQGH